MKSPRMTPTPTPRRPARGVTLIELMVGLAIGLMATLVITQVTTIWEGKKRTTTGGSDAQVNGALALQQLQRDIQMAGYGSAMKGGAGCQVRSKLGTNVQATFRLAPVVITDGANGAPDTIRVLLSNAESFSVPMITASNHTRSESSFTLVDGINIGNRVGDLMMAVPEANCEMGTLTASSIAASLFNLSATPAAGAATLDHATGSTGPWNHDNTGTIFPGTTATDISYPAGSYLLNLGNLETTRGVPLYRDFRVNSQALQSLTYTARGSTTTATSGPPATTAATASTSTDDLASQIVTLQAVYGHDTSTPRDGTADVWNTTDPTTQDGWNRVVAVRIALVARSTQYEEQEVTAAHPSNCSALTAASNYPKWMPDGSTYDCLKVSTLTDYRHYRYRVFELVVPLRNMIWQT